MAFFRLFTVLGNPIITQIFEDPMRAPSGGQGGHEIDLRND
jgi:hypothetical protein